jgi:hypothetical protein
MQPLPSMRGQPHFAEAESSNEVVSSTPAAITEESAPTPSPAKVTSKKTRIPAKWIPIGGVLAPAVLDGSMAGDVGFDPIGFAKTQKGLYWMREAETKHGRLAMLAAVGWPISELYHKQIAALFNLDSILAANDRAPSLLNGGLSNGWASGMLIMSIIIAGYLEGKAMNSGEIFYNSDKPKGYVPGNLGFDPLNLYAARGNKLAMETAEIKNGRLAMIAITAFAFQEFASKLPVVQETPYLF